MRKYNNPRLLNTVVSGTGMRNPVKPHVIISDTVNEFVKGDLMEANAISELVDQKVGSVESATGTNLTELRQALAEETAARTGADQTLDERITDLSAYIPQAISDGIAEVVAGADADYDTLKEIADYIQSDKTGAAQLNNAVSDNAAAIIAERERAIAKETQLQNDVDLKADQDTTYTKTEVDTLIDGVYASDQLANYYTKSEIDDAGYLTEHQDISNKADKSELFSGDYNDLTNKPVIPIVPTNVSAFTNDSNYQTQQLVDDRFTALINAAPAALDTLGEIADKLSDNDDAVSAIVTSISNEVDAREAADIAITTNINELATTVSTNNTTINNRVDALEASLEDRISDVEDTMPTKVSELTNDAGYLTLHQSLDNYYTKAEVDSSQQALNTEISSKADKSTTYTKTEVDNLIAPKANASDVYSKIEADSTFIKEHLSLDEYAKKTELVDAYSKTETNELLANKANSADLATVATTGSYDDLTNKPTNISEFTNDVGYLTTHQDISGKQDVITDLETIRSGAAAGSTAYQKPSDGIPKTDLSTSVLLSLNKADTAIQSHLDISGKVDKTTTVNNHALSSNVTITKSDVGLGNVTNDAQVKRSEMGTANGVATLDSNGLVPSSLLPSYVDDVLEYTSKSKFPSTGQAGKIYVDTTTNLTYRWSGTAYTEISPSIALGETSSTAYAGNKGKSLADKLNTIEEGAQVNVNADWNATSGDALILNKPTIPTKTTLGLNNVANINLSKAIKSITRSGTTFTYTCLDNTTGTFTLEPNTDTKNTAGATNTSSKIFLIGATGQTANPLTYSNSSCYIGTDNCLYSGGEKVLTSHDGNNRKAFYGTCTTAAATKDKVVTLAESAGWPGLVAGVIVGVKFTNTNTYSNATDSSITLNVNSTGAKNIWFGGTHSGEGNTGTNTTAYGRANYVNYYMYDGTYWVWMSSSNDNNTTYTPLSLGFCYGVCSTAAGTAAKTVTMSSYSLVAHGIVSIRFTNAITVANATLNINSKGAKPIYYQGAALKANVIGAGSTVVMQYNGTAYNIIGGIMSTDKLIQETMNRRTRTDFTSNGLEWFKTTLKSAIADMSLEKYGLKVGDYCTATHDGKTYNYVIAGLNTMKGTSTPYRLNYDHVGIIVDTNDRHAWNTGGTTSASTNTHSTNGTWTSGTPAAGYASCDLQYYLETTVLPNVKTDLGSGNIKSHSKFYSNAVNTSGYNRYGSPGGCSSSCDWYANQEICALSEVQVYGSIVWSSSGYDTGEACRQLDVFRVYNVNEIFEGRYPWLRDVASSSLACLVSVEGNADNRYTNNTFNVAALILFA